MNEEEQNQEQKKSAFNLSNRAWRQKKTIIKYIFRFKTRTISL